jgi:hypothetical protein
VRADPRVSKQEASEHELSIGGGFLEGVFDLHVHAAPCIYERPFDEIDLARKARDSGYGGILSKCHHAINADRAQLVRKIVDDIEVFGGIVLNYPVGGLNPSAVEAALQFGAKEVWFPTMHAAHHIKFFGEPEWPLLKRRKASKDKARVNKGIFVMNEDGDLKPEVYEILDLIAASDVVLGTGHLSREEVYALIKGARRSGVRRILVTHPEAFHWSVEDMVRMADLGAVLELCVNSYLTQAYHVSIKSLVEAIRKAGASRTVMATDLGQVYNPHPVDGMLRFINDMVRYGISEKEVAYMTKDHPAKLLGLS